MQSHRFVCVCMCVCVRSLIVSFNFRKVDCVIFHSKTQELVYLRYRLRFYNTPKSQCHFSNFIIKKYLMAMQEFIMLRSKIVMNLFVIAIQVLK